MDDESMQALVHCAAVGGVCMDGQGNNVEADDDDDACVLCVSCVTKRRE